MTWWGDQAIALTAATWSEYVWNGVVRSPLFHTISLLSFPPDAKSWPSGDHLSPQISCLCPISFFSPWPLISRYKLSIVNKSNRNEYYLKNDTITWPRTQLISIPRQGTNSHLVTFYCSNAFRGYRVPNLNPEFKSNPRFISISNFDNLTNLYMTFTCTDGDILTLFMPSDRVYIITISS